MLVSSKVVRNGAALSRKIHLQVIEFNEIFRVAGTLPQKKT